MYVRTIILWIYCYCLVYEAVNVLFFVVLFLMMFGIVDEWSWLFCRNSLRKCKLLNGTSISGAKNWKYQFRHSPSPFFTVDRFYLFDLNSVLFFDWMHLKLPTVCVCTDVRIVPWALPAGRYNSLQQLLYIRCNVTVLVLSNVVVSIDVACGEWVLVV